MHTPLTFCQDARDMAHEENARLKKALAFWLPGVPAEDNARANRLAEDAALLVGYDGPYEHDAETLGWISLAESYSPEREQEIRAKLDQRKQEQFCIHHYYDLGNQRAYIRRVTATTDPVRAAVYCQFKCEEWYGVSMTITNQGIASLLTQFYGFEHCPADPLFTDIDMFFEREKACDELFAQIMADSDLHRHELREAMAPYTVA
jgi:hypothetical protein